MGCVELGATVWIEPLTIFIGKEREFYLSGILYARLIRY